MIELEVEEVLAQEDDDFGPGQHADVDRQPEFERELADDSVAKSVECRDGRVCVSVGHELIDSDLHLRRRLVGEGQREDLGGPCATRGDEPCDPPSDDLGLARAGPGQHKERSIAVGHRSTLLRIQAIEEHFEADRALVRDCDASRRDVGPHGDLLEGAGLAHAPLHRLAPSLARIGHRRLSGERVVSDWGHPGSILSAFATSLVTAPRKR